MALDADLAAYYDAEARAGLRGELEPLRIDIRRRFAELLRLEGRARILDVGAGPGRDTSAFRDGAFDAIGLDLAPENVKALARKGLGGVVGSLYALPFPGEAFDAVWTMSTLVHVPRQRFDAAMAELLRVVPAGAPLGIGSWGGRDFEGISENDELRRQRYFSLASHARWRSMLARHGRLECFETFPATRPGGWEYQYAVLRRTEERSVSARRTRRS